MTRLVSFLVPACLVAVVSTAWAAWVTSKAMAPVDGVTISRDSSGALRSSLRLARHGDRLVLTGGDVVVSEIDLSDLTGQPVRPVGARTTPTRARTRSSLFPNPPTQ